MNQAARYPFTWYFSQMISLRQKRVCVSACARLCMRVCVCVCMLFGFITTNGLGSDRHSNELLRWHDEIITPRYKILLTLSRRLAADACMWMRFHENVNPNHVASRASHEVFLFFFVVAVCRSAVVWCVPGMARVQSISEPTRGNWRKRTRKGGEVISLT